MARLKSPLSHFAAFLVLLLPLPACSSHPNQYSAEAIEAWVVDAETKQPLSDVIVVANWGLHVGTIDGRKPGGQLVVMETVADKDGRFSFPAWGPKRRPFNTFLDNMDPGLALFKPGYEYRGMQNSVKSYVNNNQVRQSRWSGKTIELKKFDGNMKKYARNLSFLHTTMRSILIDGECDWKQIPKLIIAVDQQERIFRKNKIYSSLYSINDLTSNGCGSPEEFFRSYRP